MAKAKKEDQPVKEEAPVTSKEGKDYPDFSGDAKQGYVDINNPDHGNKTYEELQAEANKSKK